MVAGSGEDAVDRLDVPPEAVADRLLRRVAGLERQLELRIARAEDLQREVDGLRRELAATQEALVAASEKAGQYDALLETFTMRVLRQPRAWYGAARGRLRGRRGATA